MSRSRGNLLRNEARCKKSVTVIVMDPSLTGVICQLIHTETSDSVNKPKLPLKKHEKESTGGVPDIPNSWSASNCKTNYTLSTLEQIPCAIPNKLRAQILRIQNKHSLFIVPMALRSAHFLGSVRSFEHGSV